MMNANDEIMCIVAKLIKKYTKNESFSVTYEKVEQLIEATKYCLDEHQRSCSPKYNKINHPSKNNPNLSALYQRGLTLVEEKIRLAMALYNEITSDFNPLNNQCYEETVLNAMPYFFSYYDPYFSPQDHLITLDYPLLVDQNNLSGIDKIYEYLQCINHEQCFLSQTSNIHNHLVLRAFEEDYEDGFLNISRPIFRNLLCHCLANTLYDGSNGIDAIHYFLKDHVSSISKDKLVHQLRDYTSDLLMTKLSLPKALCQYFEEDLSDFAFELRSSYSQKAYLLI